MVANHIDFSFDTAASYGSDLKAAVRRLHQTVEDLSDHLGTMDQMKDNGVIGAYLQSKYGFTTLADAQDAYDELNSVLGKLTTDGAVTDVHAAIVQIARKFK